MALSKEDETPRRHRLTAGDGGPEGPEAAVGRTSDDGGQRNQDDDAQPEGGDPQ